MYLGRVYLEVTGLDLPLVSTGISESFVFLVCVGFGSFLLTLYILLHHTATNHMFPYIFCLRLDGWIHSYRRLGRIGALHFWRAGQTDAAPVLSRHLRTRSSTMFR
jgi:hypothetical protein